MDTADRATEYKLGTSMFNQSVEVHNRFPPSRVDNHDDLAGRGSRPGL